MLSVERLRREPGQINIVEATDIDVDLVRVRARHVERMNAAVPAERVLRRFGIELVGGQIVLAADELEAFRRDDQVQNSLLGADRTIAIDHRCEVGGGERTHVSAVSTACSEDYQLTIAFP